MKEPCPIGAGGGIFGNITVTCSGTDSIVGETVLDFQSSKGPISTLSVDLTLPDGVDDYGVVTCDAGTFTACTSVSDPNLITFSPDITSGSAETTTLNIGNGAHIPGDIVLYFDSPADVTGVRATFSSVPEPGSVALLGLGIVAAGFFAWRRRAVRL